MVHFKIFKLNVCASLSTIRCLLKYWKTYWLRLFLGEKTNEYWYKNSGIGIPHQRIRVTSGFEQGFHNFSHKKRRAKETMPKAPAISHQGNEGFNMPNNHVCFSVAFLNSLSKVRRTEFLWTRVLQVVPQKKEGRKIKAWGCCCFLSMETLSKAAADVNELHCCNCNLNIYSLA